MAKDESFDIVSEVDMQEVDNAVNQATKEINTRFDLKETGCTIERQDTALTLNAPDEMKLRNILEILQQKLIKRSIDPKALKEEDPESALGGKYRQLVTLKQGLDKEQAKKLTTLLKETKIKVNAQIQDDKLRVTGKNRDDLQKAIAAVKAAELDFPVQFENYR
ncbi:MAG: YajQ family cyclic di-GMP-binding protein [Candidatus Sericytochromatia bacterium]|nr:YajQ family cyclic di-GMP-binding protein [Candidatus Sericytochromatia bacterium]